MLFVSFLLQSVSLITLMVMVFFIERIQQLVGRPDGSYKLLAGIFCLIINALCIIGANTGQFAGSSWGMGAIVSHLFAAAFMMVATYELRNYVRVRALSRLNTQNPAPKPVAAAPPTPAASEEAGEPQIVCNSDMEVVELNQGAARLLGRDMTDVAGKSITNLVRKEEMLLVPELFRQVKAGEAQGGEWSFRLPDESLVPVRINVRQHSGDQIRLVIQDLTDGGESAKAAAPVAAGNDQLIVSLLDASADGYVAFDPDLKIVAWNTRMEKLTGVLRDQCLNQHLLMHFPVPEELAEEDYFLDSLEGHTNELANAPIINPDTNETHIVDFHFAPLFNPTKEIIGGMVVVRKPVSLSTPAADEPAVEAVEEEPAPITFAMPGDEEAETPVAEPIIEEAPVVASGSGSEPGILENAFAAAAHIVSVFDLETETEAYANRSLAEELGFNEAQIAGLGEHPLHEIIHPEDQPNLPRASADWNDGSVISRRITEFRAIDPERQWHWFQSADTVLERDSYGNVSKIVSIIQNITQDKEDERQLRLAEQKYRTFSEHCPTGIWHLTPGGTTHYANPAMCRILGIDSPDALEGRTYHEFITPDSQLNIATQAAPAPGDIPTVEIDIQRPDGSLRKCLLHGQPELDEAGQIRNLMGSFVDITELTEPASAPDESPAAVVDEVTHAALQSELEEALDKLKSAHADLEQSRTTVQELETARDDALALAEDTGSRIGDLESELEQVRGELAEKDTVQLDVQTAQDELKSALEKAGAALATAESERDEAKLLLAELNSELDQTKEELDTANAALTEVRTAGESDTQALTEVKEELQLTKEFLEAAGAQQEQAKQSLNEAQGELQTVKEQLTESEKSRDEARAELESTKSALAEAEKSRDEANQLLTAADTEQETTKTALVEAEKSRDEANQSLAAANAELETTKTALAEAEKSRDEANQSLAAANTEQETTKSALAEAEKSRDEANQLLTAADTEQETTKSALAEAEKSRDEANQSLAAANTELETTKSALAEAEKSRDEANQSLAAANTELETNKSSLAETQESLSAARAEAESTQSDLSTTEQSLAEAKTQHEEALALVTEAEGERDKATQSLNDTLAELDQLKSQLADEKATREEADNALADAQVELKKTRSSLKKAEAAREKSAAAADELRAELSAAQKALHETETVHLEVKTSQDETSAALTAAQTALAAAESERDENAAELKKTRALLAQTETAREQADKALAKSEPELKQSKTLAKELQTELKRTTKELDQTKAKLSTAETKAGESIKALKNTSSSKSELTQQLNQLQSQLDEAKAAREQADQSLSQSQAELEQTRTAQNDLEAKLSELNRELKQTNSELAEANKSLENVDSSKGGQVTELQVAFDETRSALAAAETARQQSDEELSKTKAELDAARGKLAEIEASTSDDETALELAEAAIAELEAKHKDAKDALFDANRKWQEQEDAVAESERKFSNLQYHLTGIAYRQQNDDTRSVEFISVGCAAFTGHAPEQFTSGGKSLVALIHPDDRDAVVAAMNEAAKAGQGYQVDYRLLHEDGTERRVSDRGCGVFNARKKLIAFEGVITEVIERKSGGDLAETPIHTLPAGVWITNAEGRTTYNNATWTDITGFESGNGLDWSEAVHGEDRARITRAFKDAAARHEICEEVFRVRQRDGQFCWMRMIATPRLDARERFTGYLGTCFDITENIHAVEELKAGQRQLEWAQTRAKLGSWEYHPATNVRRWSKQTSLIYNLRPDQELPGSFEDYLQLVHEDDRAKITATNDNVLKTGRPVGNLEFRTNPAKGPQRHLTATVYRVPEEDGSAYYLAGTVMDVSDQKAAEDNVRRSEERYRKIIEVAEEGVWMMDAEGYTSFVNPRMMQMLGYRYREFIGRHFFEFLESESTKEAEEYMERRQKGISEQAEFVFLRKDGKPVNVLINSSSLKDADGDFIGILTLVSDITARKAANAEAEKEQQQIRTVLASTPDHILSVDERKIVRFINRDYAGMKPDQIVGTPALNWVTPDHRERYDEALQVAFEKGEAQEFEMNGLGPDNTTATYRTRVRPVTENDKITSLLVVSQDITGQQTAAPKVAKAKPAAARQQDFSRQLLTSQENELRSLSNLLHDEFGQSLSATKLTLQSLAQAEKNAKNRKRIESSLESLENLIVKTRKLSHDLRSPVLDDLGLFPALRGLVTAQADSTGIALDFQAEEIERLDGEIETTAFRVVEEALANVVQHAKAKAATVAMKKDGDQLKLTIIDNGKGFDIKKARAGKTFGLVGMEERVNLVGGTINVESKPKKGTTIEVSLPLPPAAPAKRKRKARKKSK